LVALEDGLWDKKYKDEEERRQWEKAKDELAAEKRRLEGMKEYWTKQMGSLQQTLLAAATTQTGNDFATRRWGHRVVCNR
jgi:hypothetical protein